MVIRFSEIVRISGMNEDELHLEIRDQLDKVNNMFDTNFTCLEQVEAHLKKLKKRLESLN